MWVGILLVCFDPMALSCKIIAKPEPFYSEEACLKQAEKRKRVMPAPYNGSEDLFIKNHEDIIPANLIVDLTGLESWNEIYKETEWYILKAKAFYNAEEVMNIELKPPKLE